MGQGPVAFGTGGDDFLDSPFFDGGHIQPGKLQKILPVTGPEQIVAAASFTGQKRGVNIEKIQKPQAVDQDIPGLDSQMRLEISIEIRRASPEK